MLMTSKEKNSAPVVLSVAGLDPSGGAGFTADLKTFAAHGLYGVSCATALTVQSTQGVRRVSPVSPLLVRETLECLADDMPIVGVKIGMLGSLDVLRAVADWLRTRESVPVVLDPVLRSSSGADLLEAEALETLRSELLPQVSVVTPNLNELARLTGGTVSNRGEVEGCARSLKHLPGCEALNVIVTGGHLADGPDDYVLAAGEALGRWLLGDWIETTATHGTGCAFSSALLCQLVRGENLQGAAEGAKRYVAEAMRAAYPVGSGRGPMHHLFAFKVPEKR